MKILFSGKNEEYVKFSGKSKRLRCAKLIRKNTENIYIANLHRIIQIKILEKVQNSEKN